MFGYVLDTYESVCVLAMLAGFAFGCLSFVTTRGAIRRQRKLRRYTGRVLAVTSDWDHNEDELRYRPKVAVTLPGGQAFESWLPQGQGRLRDDFAPGDEITVWLDPVRPGGTLTASRRSLYTVPIVSGLMALAGVGVGSMFLLAR